MSVCSDNTIFATSKTCDTGLLQRNTIHIRIDVSISIGERMTHILCDFRSEMRNGLNEWLLLIYSYIYIYISSRRRTDCTPKLFFRSSFVPTTIGTEKHRVFIVVLSQRVESVHGHNYRLSQSVGYIQFCVFGRGDWRI